MTVLFLHENIIDEVNEISQEDKKALDVLNFVGMNYKAGLSVKVNTQFIPKGYNNSEFKREEEKLETTEITDINSRIWLATQVVHQNAQEQYKRTSENIKDAQTKKKFRKRSLKELMQQSAFHGKSWMGDNFIA